MSNDDQLQALERLAKLRDSGALTEEEFAAKKAAILNEAATVHAPFYRRLWFVVLLTCLILTFPIALIILLTGEVYRKVRGTHKPISNKARYIYASILGLWLAAAIIKAIIDPSELKMASDQKPNISPSSQSASSASQAPALEANQAAASAPATNPASAPNAQQPSNSNQPDQAAAGPGMRVEMAPTEATGMIVTGDDDQPFTIKRIIYNGRASETGCDYPDFAPKIPAELQAFPEAQLKSLQGIMPELEGPFAKTLKRGQQATYYSSCGKILTVEIQTDRGTSRFTFENGN